MRSTNVSAVRLRCISSKTHRKWELARLHVCVEFRNTPKKMLVEPVPDVSCPLKKVSGYFVPFGLHKEGRPTLLGNIGLILAIAIITKMLRLFKMKMRCTQRRQ